MNSKAVFTPDSNALATRAQKSTNGTQPDELIVLCDGDSDRLLFNKIKRCHPLLTKIPDANVKTYDQARNIMDATKLEEAILKLHQDDRPDFIFCLHDMPVLVNELTQHAYTGDNGLQRFARFAAAAENGVPFIYFGPLRRVRDDELDSDRTASARSLTSDVFEGMKRLSEVHNTPQIYIEWKTNSNGLPATLPARSTDVDVLEIYGELLNTIAIFLFEAPLFFHGTPTSNAKVIALQNKTSLLATDTNTRFSDVRFRLKQDEVQDLLASLGALVPRMEKVSYFTKGKPDKTLALYAINASRVEFVQMPNGEVRRVTKAQLNSIIARILALPKFRKSAWCYYTGYKWRSDPHCGVLVSLDYRLCRKPGERFPQDRSTGLIVTYPRVSLSAQSAAWKELRKLAVSRPTALKNLFNKRYGKDANEKIEACLKSDNLFALWKNNAKQARLFRRYADIIVLNDGLVLGDSLFDIFCKTT